MNLNYLKKKKYLNFIKTNTLNNDLFFFWNFRFSNNNLKSFIKTLNLLNLKTVWLKKNIFFSVYLKKENKVLNFILKTQCYFSFGNLNNINNNELFKQIFLNLKELIFVGMILKNNILITKNRFNMFKNVLSDINFNDLNTTLYKNTIQKYFFYIIFLKKNMLLTYYVNFYKKNFTFINILE